MSLNPDTRRYDLDWLRVILFGILVPYHALIGFVSYGHRIYGFRNQDVGGDAAEFTLFILHAWRLPALFLISGVGTYFLLRNRGVWAFVSNRAIRLLIPLVVGVLLWNGVSAYYQLRAQGEEVTVLSFWLERWQNLSPSRLGHLWFLRNLFIYSILGVPLFLWLLRAPQRSSRPVLAVLLGWLIAVPLFVKPQAVTTEVFAWKYLNYFAYYILGFWLMCAEPRLWEALSRFRFVLLIGAIASVSGLGLFLLSMGAEPEVMNLVVNGGWRGEGWPLQTGLTVGYSLLYAVNTLLWCAAIFAFAHRHLNRPSKLLPRLNRAVYPFYIFHIPVLFAGLYYLRFTSWHWLLECTLLTLGTFVVTGVVYLIADAIPPMRPLVGLGPKR